MLGARSSLVLARNRLCTPNPWKRPLPYLSRSLQGFKGFATVPTGSVNEPHNFNFSIDRGGTFTDVYATWDGDSKQHPEGYLLSKLLSVDPANYPDAPREGIRRVLEQVLERPFPAVEKIDTAPIASIRMGTTVATNALLEREGEPMALAITDGFRDLLQIGNQSRPELFDLSIRKPDILYDEVVQVKERVRVGPVHSTHHPLKPLDIVKGVTGEKVEIIQRLDEAALTESLQQVYDKGIRSLAVVLMHSYTYRDHEQIVERIAKEIGFTHVSLSSSLTPMVRAVPRGQTAMVDAYLTPLIKEYISGFSSGFDNNLVSQVDVSFMQSDGGLTPVNKFSGFRAILSGPAGGVVGFAETTFDKTTARPVIGYDMGGTSTDVSRFDGFYEHVFETETAGVITQAPQLDITTVAAGGGSRLFFRNGMFTVGPESSRAHPGPICYRKGGYLSITDANLFLGRIEPEYFPKIFGENEDQPLDYEATRLAFEELTSTINEELSQTHQENDDNVGEFVPLTPDQVAAGFVRVGNEAMCRPIRTITEAKGHAASDHILACFGGAGGQHACAIARSLGMDKVFVHRFSGILSAYGISMADIVHEEQAPFNHNLTQAGADATISSDTLSSLETQLNELGNKAVAALKEEGFNEDNIEVESFLNLRFDGTDTCIMIRKPETGIQDFAQSFLDTYSREYGFLLQRPVLVDDYRVRAIGKTKSVERKSLEEGAKNPAPVGYSQAYFDDGRVDTPFYQLEDLGSGDVLHGPCIILDKTSTVVVEPHCVAYFTSSGDISIDINPVPKNTSEQPAESSSFSLSSSSSSSSSTQHAPDAIKLAVFANRFMSIADQMGRTLQRTSVSTNIKDRLDFSCALFGPDGGLVANAPHVPVHLGSMQEALKYQIQTLGDNWKEGEVLMANHPSAGGSHLPDITIMTPVFAKNGDKPVFYVASRGHHADIGGITPGSMPPLSTKLTDEGASFFSFKLVKDGLFQEEELTKRLLHPVEQFPPGESPPEGYEPQKIIGTRTLRDNISDLKAQVAANQRGILLVQDLIKEYGLVEVQQYMNHVQSNAEQAVRNMLCQVSLDHGLPEIASLESVDYMDDGSPIKLKLTINRNKKTAHFDFTGTGAQVMGNWNAPYSITMSAIIYSLRCLINQAIPLNQGCLAPISVTLPENSLLSPSPDAAVVAGNVLVSQRITDVVLTTFGAAACSQGCTNNLSFGDDDKSQAFGYYETIAGGAGAGPGWHGQHGVHTHMTNTRITDVELLERRYPTLVHQFSLRPGSGGIGQYNGGDGVIRDIEFLRPLQVSIMSERRAFAPKGLDGGGDGQRGLNHLVSSTGKVINVGGKASVLVNPGDRLQIMTPGGGAYGPSNK